MRYEKKVELRGDAGEALGVVERVLVGQGFLLERAEEDFREFRGSGMHSSKQDPLRGASEVRAKAHGGWLNVEAELGGVRSLGLFVTIFPVVLWCALLLIPVLKAGGDWSLVNAQALLGGAIWLVIGPAMATLFKARTVKALDIMVQNAVTMAGQR